MASHWGLLAVCALFLLVGAVVLDDYGSTWDGPIQRATGKAAVDYVLGDGERAFDQLESDPLGDAHNRYYGAVFEAPVYLITRILGLDNGEIRSLDWDGAENSAAREFLTHLCFLAGGVFCYLLILRMFGSRRLALVAMVMFLLHPRIYAHSFFNLKDISFLTMFMVSLSLTHRAFRRETLGAFLLCGVGVGLLINLRIMGVLLFGAVLVLQGLDMLFGPAATDSIQRGRRLAATGAFALAAVLTYYASLPALWTDPVGRFADLIGSFRSHPLAAYQLFRGEWLEGSNGLPLEYVPVWAGITTPPAVLLLALGGAIALVWRGVRRPRDVQRNGPLRFGLLLVAVPVVTVAAVFVLRSNVFDGWRHLYFLYAPLLLLAIIGLRQLAIARRGRWMRVGAYALTGAAVAVTVVSLVRIHPHGSNYFNVLTDRTTPERLTSRYFVSPFGDARRVAVAAILADHPSGNLYSSYSFFRYLRGELPPDGRGRFTRTRNFRSGDRNFFEVPPSVGSCPFLAGPYVVRLYANPLLCLVDPVAYFGDVRRAALAADPVVRSRYDVYRDGRTLTWVRDECSAADIGSLERFFLHVYPHDTADLAPWRARDGLDFDNLDHIPQARAARIDGSCVAVARLPDYPIARVQTGQVDDWSVEVPPDLAGARRDALAGEPLARGAFDVYGEGRTLTYVRDGCMEEEAAAHFFLHLYPADVGDLPESRREHGFDNLDAALEKHIGRIRGNCIAIVRLPDYPITSIHTGQYDESGQRWATEFALPDGE